MKAQQDEEYWSGWEEMSTPKLQLVNSATRPQEDMRWGEGGAMNYVDIINDN